MILPPVPTPFDAAGRPDWDALQAILDRLAPAVDGFLVFGSNGEAPLLTPEERRAGFERLKVRGFFLAGVGDESLPQAAGHLEAAREAGADAALAFPPRFFAGLLDEAAYLTYFEGLAQLGLPVWLYHVPQLTKVPLPLPVVERLARLPGVEGIKDSSGDVSRFAFYDAKKLGLRVFSGSAVVFLPALLFGAEGGILAVANLVPGLVRAIQTAFLEGRLEEARRLQNALDPFARLLGQGGPVLLKQAMRHLGFPAGRPRPPYPEHSPLWPELYPLLLAFQEGGYTA